MSVSFLEGATVTKYQKFGGFKKKRSVFFHGSELETQNQG